MYSVLTFGRLEQNINSVYLGNPVDVLEGSQFEVDICMLCCGPFGNESIMHESYLDQMFVCILLTSRKAISSGCFSDVLFMCHVKYCIIKPCRNSVQMNVRMLHGNISLI